MKVNKKRCWVVGQFELGDINTPKAFANFSPGLERSDNPGRQYKKVTKTLKALGMCRNNPFQGLDKFLLSTQGCRYAPTLGWS